MMADRWQMQVMADRLDSERLRGFDNRQMDGQTFAIVESLSPTENEKKQD